MRSVPAATWLALALGFPPTALALASVTGIGLLRGIPGLLSLVAAGLVTLLPIVGASALHRRVWPDTRTWRRRLVALWLWPMLILVALPGYFPGDRGTSTEAGLRLLAAPLGDAAAGRLAGLGRSAVALLGDDPRPLASEPITGRSESGVADGASTPLATARTSRAASPPRSSERGRSPDERTTFLVPYEGDERSVQLEVDFDGPRYGERYKMIFDTGATYTTLRREAVANLGIDIPRDAPVVSLQTANGTIEAPLVLVDAVWLGDEAVEWVTIAVCDSCGSDEIMGLLGLNVARRFHVALDHDRHRLELRRRDDGDRLLDVQQWLRLRSSATRYLSGKVEVELSGHNLARQAIERAVATITCGGEGFAIQLDDIPASGEASTRVDLPRGTDCSSQNVQLSHAAWVLDRF